MKRKTLYVNPDGLHEHREGFGGAEHSHQNLEWEIQHLIDTVCTLQDHINELKDTIAVAHARIDELEIELDE